MSNQFNLEKFDQEKIKKLNDRMAEIDEAKFEESLIHVLHFAQGQFGYLPEAIQLHIARTLNIPAAKVFGVVSFYSYFNTKPVGKYTISVCMGTACFVRGAEKVLNEFKKQLEVETGETTTDKMFTLKDVRCVGACGLAPVVMIGEDVFGSVTTSEVSEIITEYRNKEE